MSINKLSYMKLDFLSPITTIDTYGTSVLNYTKVFETDGRINYSGGIEFLIDGKISTIPTYMIYIENNLLIDTTWQIFDQSTNNKYDILYIYPISDYNVNHHLQILVKKINAYNLI